MKLFVGIDVSSKRLDVCFLDSEDTRLKEVALPNDVHGANQIKEMVLTFNDKHHYEQIVIGMESTSVYSFHPSTLLDNDKDLQRIGAQVVVQNPKAIHRFKGMFEEDKTDQIDAFRIADFLRFGRFNKTVIKEEKYIALQRLTRSRYQVVHQLTECKQHFIKNLYYKCNTLSNDVDTSMFGTTMIELITGSFSLDDIANMELEDLANFLQEKGKGRFKDPEQLAKAIKKAIRDSYRLGKVVQDSVDTVLAMYAKLVQTLNRQIKDLEKGIIDILKTIPESKCLITIPGIGPVYTGGIIAEIGNIERFESRAQLANMLHCIGRNPSRVTLNRNEHPGLWQVTNIYVIT